MGQDQSLQSRTPPSGQSTRHSSLRRTLSDQQLTKTDGRTAINRFHSTMNLKDGIVSANQDYQQESTTPSEQDDEGDSEEIEGMVSVVKAVNDNTQDPTLSKLQLLEPVRPLIPNTTRSPFGLENLIDMGSAGMKGLLGKESIRSSSSSIKTSSSDARMDPLVDILLTLQAHINKNMSKINQNQRRLLSRIKHVDELSLKTSQIMSIALHQSKVASDRLNEAKHIKNLAKETRHYTTSIFESLQRIQHLLDPEDRVGHPDFEKRWPVLHSLHLRSTASNGRPPAFLPASSSSSSSSSSCTTTTLIKDDITQQQKSSTTTSVTNIASVTENSTQQADLNHSSNTLVMDRLRGLIGDSTLMNQDEVSEQDQGTLTLE